ncbi:sensor domain-containing protein [Nocardiopsis sp. CNT-189]|uniref:sensor histidine kinase n=1 Tax=Nocardiopsis oceanisediminis TaxID=2816862 RepID=UPI003B3631EF
MASGAAARSGSRWRSLRAVLFARRGWSERTVALLGVLTSFVLSFLYLLPAGMLVASASSLAVPLVQNVSGVRYDPASVPRQLLFAGVMLVGALLVARLCCRIQRSRLGDTHGVQEAALPDPLAPRSLPGRALTLVFGAESWHALLYTTLAGAQGLIAGALALGMLFYGVGGTVGTIVVFIVTLVGATGLAPLLILQQQLLSLVAGTAGLLLGLWLSPLLVGAELAVARRLLFDAPEIRVRRRLLQVQDSRSRMVDAAEAERRRIERDLHDGAQQRLLAVTMTLSRAHAQFDRDPEKARALLEEARREAKEVMGDLRDVARGLHPKVLTDHGLEAALPVAAGRAPMPVKVEADLGERPSPRAEGVAYYVASEALTNIAKHAGAGRAQVAAARVRGAGRHGADLLRVTVTDDGAGGADPSLGSGLYGLWDRVDAVDGELRVHSPKGGGTVLTADIPWEA